MNEIENPLITIESLSLFEKKVESGEITSNELKILDDFISNVTNYKDYLLTELKEYNINSYEEYTVERKSINRNRAVDGILLGKILGAINILKKYLANK